MKAMVEIAESIQPCSVRALAYQLFNRKLIDSMAIKHTRKVSELCVVAREEGLLPWEWITDQTRQEEKVSTWNNPASFARSVQDAYRRNKWADQPKHISVWSEKATIAGTIRPVLEKYEVPFQILHGWSGATPVWDAAQENIGRHQDTLILYVGDFDPSGMFMSEVDLPKRLARYSSNDARKEVSSTHAALVLEDVRLTIRRIALTGRDTQELGSSTRFPASDKTSDTRYEWFVRNHGHWCWELDAMSPTALRSRVDQAILDELNMDSWERYTAVEKVEREAIIATCQSWGSISVPDQE